MFDLILSYVWLILTRGFLYIALPYYFYTRVIDVYLSYYHYSNQEYTKLKCVGFPMPVFGNFFQTLPILKKLLKNNDNKVPFTKLIEEKFGGPSYEGVILHYVAHKPRLYICDPKFCEGIYVTQNAHYNLTPNLRNLFYCFTGGSILFSQSNDHWRARRKAMTPAYFKEKIRGVVKLAGLTVKNSITRMKVVKEGQTFEVMEEILKTVSEVLMSVSMSEDVSTLKIDYWKNGKCTKEDMSFVFRDTLGHLIARASAPHIIMFPSLVPLNVTAFEREMVKNATSCREGIRQLLKKRKDSPNAHKSDLLSILLEDPLFAHDEEACIDEMITMWAAGATTTAHGS